VRDAGDHVVATGRLRALGNESRATIESPIWTVTRWNRGKATYVRTYLDRDEALKALSLFFFPLSLLMAYMVRDNSGLATS